MKKIGGVFLLLSGVLLVPLALLVHRALGSAEAERAAQHRAVAERVFDEIERELTAFLRREEDRPFAHYRFSWVSEGPAQTRAEPTRSPLADPPSEPFVVGYFQLEPDGTVGHPRWPRPDERPAVWQPADDLRVAVAEVEQVVREVWSSTSSRARSPAGPANDLGPGSQEAGTTIPVTKNKEQVPAKKLPQERYLDSLNRAVEERRGRTAKQEVTQSSTFFNFLSPEAAEDDRFDGTTADGRATGGAGEERSTETIDVSLEPMFGRLADPRRLVLFRHLRIDGQDYRQGLVIAVPELIAWSAQRVLTDPELASRVELRLPSDAPAVDGEAYTYHHRFAEPFASVTAEIGLATLPELAGNTYLYSLSLLLALAATVGLFAVYRMVAVAVDYAERRNNFVSSVTHELKTPLTAIRMYGEMLRDDVVPDPAQRHDYYGIITAESERLTRLLNNVLELARLEKKNRSMNLVVEDVRPVVRDVLEVLGPHAERQGFHLELDAAADLPPARYDRDALLQVLVNLVDNALKYARGATDKTIVLRCRGDGDGLSLTVADRGPGVDRRHLKRIFEPFYRGENELTRTAKGTGIGLALVRGLVERMGGRVSGRNAGEGGFEVTVSLATA